MASPALPPDGHVHSEWSWDAVAGSMERSCARAVELGLPSIAFTEHVDQVRWSIPPDVRARMARGEQGPTWERVAAGLGPAGGHFQPAPLDVEGYLASIARCRARFPDLRILSGVELGEPHRFADRVGALLASGSFDRALGSVHSLMYGGELREVGGLYLAMSPPELVRAYLAEATSMIEASDAFHVLAHIDYPIRRWPPGQDPHEPTDFEEEYRTVLRALARSGRALEVNTRLPLHPAIVRWWHEEGGPAVTFGSDAHDPALVAHGFAEAAAMVEAQGFRPGNAPDDFWRRSLSATIP